MAIADAPMLDVRPLLPGERRDLLDLLTDLTSEEWSADTACPGWTVKDIALHVLGEELGWLSRGRDGDTSGLLDDSIEYRELVQLLDAKNRRWVDGAGGLSPRVVIDLLRWSGDELDRYVERIDLDEPSSVIWSGPEPTPRWFDLARDFTERWVHQQQIRDAVRRPRLDETHTGVVLRTFLWALPHHYREVPAADGSTVAIWITGPGGGAWGLVRVGDAAWDLSEGEPDRRDAEVALSSDAAWRVLTGGAVPDEAVELRGELRLAHPFRSARAIIV
jgi:uncharacterized protein (TIGR03083 family)